MKKMIALIAFLAITGTASADLINGDFQNGVITTNVFGAIIGDYHMNVGWVNKVNWGIGTNEANYYVYNENAAWTQADTIPAQYSFGQTWLDPSGLPANGAVEFDVVLDEYSSAVPNPQIRVELFGAKWEMTWEKFRVSNSTNASDGGVLVYLLDELIDVSYGVTNNYSTSFADLSGYTNYAIRISGRTSATSWLGEHIGLDNIEIVVPEPVLFGLLGFGVIAFIRRR